MALVTPDEGQLELMTNMLITNSFSGYNYEVDLYQNNYTPIQSSTGSDFTIANFTGYSQQTFTRTEWTTPATVSDQAFSQSTENPFTWTCGATGNTIYGYLIRSSATGKVLWAELFATPVVLTNGAIIELNIQITVFGANP